MAQSYRSLTSEGTLFLTMLVLVTDDDRAVREALERALQLAGYEVELASDGDTALSAIERRTPDAVVLDVMMPGLDGLDVTRRLRREGNRVPVLLLTARDAVGDRVEGLDAGADDYLPKPFALEELLARIRALLRRALEKEPAIPDEGPSKRASSSPTTRNGQLRGSAW